MTQDDRKTAHDGAVFGVSVAILHEGRFLLVERGREPSKGMLAFPGGRVHVGESDEAAARRELLEETGLTVGAMQPFRHYMLPRPAGQGSAFRLLVFKGIGPAGTLTAGDDAASAGWYTIAEMRSLSVIPSVLETALALAGESD